MLPGVHFEESIKTAICQVCHSGVVCNTSNSINNHFRPAPHHLRGHALKTVHACFQDWPIVPSHEVPYPALDAQPVPAIPHLKIHRGWFCKHCLESLGTDLANTKTHLRTLHRVFRGREGHDFEGCLLQTVFHERRLVRYFRVVQDFSDNSAAEGPPKPSHVQDFVSSQTDILRQIEAAEEFQVRTVQDGSDHKSSVIPWVRCCGFDRHLKGLDKKEMRRSWRKVEDDEPDAALIRKVLQVTQEVLDETWQWCVDGPRCRLTRPMAVILSQFWTEATIHARGFRTGIGADTKTRYFDLWKGLILCFWRVSSGRVLARKNDEIPEKCSSGKNEQEAGDEVENGDRDSSSPTEEEMPLFTGTPEQRLAFDACLEAAADEDDTLLHDTVLAWSMAMIQHDLPRYRFESPVLSYCGTLAVNYSSLGWKLPGNFNSSLSGMIYCAQLWIFREACRLVDGGLESGHLDEVLARLCQRWMRQERSTTYGIILNWRLMLFHVARQEVSSKKATWSLDDTEVCYQGTAITMDQITQLYRRTMARAELIMRRDLLLGAEHLPQITAADLFEGEHRQEMGWWFALDPRNAPVLEGRETRLIEHIRSTSAIRTMFLDEHDEWRPSAMRLYESHVQQLLECLFVLFQIFPPLRGPECLSVTVRNTEKLRSAILKHGRIMFHTTYHKGQAQWGSYKENVRFPTVAFNNLFLRFSVFVQPLRRLFLWHQHGRLLPPQLWTKDGHVWDENILTPVFQKVCALAEVPRMSDSHWRQLCASIVKAKFAADRRCFDALVDKEKGEDGADDDDDDGEDEDAATLARMSNHTVRTHNRAYANETSLVGVNIWDGLIKRSYRACMLWSQFFGLEEVEHQSSTKRERDEVADGRGMLKKIALSVPKKHWSGRALLQEARRIYQNPNLQWTCPEQEQAMCAIVAGKMEVVVVMATGMGKSLLFQLPACLPEVGTTVLIVPLVALRLDLIRRCQVLGVDCQEWSINRESRAALVLMSVEAVTLEDGRAYLHRLYHEKRLTRIVFDECQLAVIASSYRRDMIRVPLLRSIPVQFVYLTATLPPHVKDVLFQRHYLSQVHEIRASTRRRNLRYGVLRLQCHQHDLIQVAADTVQRAWQQRFQGQHGLHRAIVFTRSKAEADCLASLLSCASYHSETGDVQDKARILTSWAAGSSSPFLVGTSGLGAGLDYPQVRLVLHVDQPYSAIEFVQEAGRGGRDGEEAESIVILRHGWQPGIQVDGEKQRALDEFLDTRACRRPVIDRYIDGVEDAEACGSRDVPCDNCDRGVQPAERRVPIDPAPTPAATGPKLMLRQFRDGEEEISSYTTSLEAIRGQCMICRIHGLDEWQHSFSQCRQVHKWRYIHAKKAALRQSRGGWIGKYEACFHCFQPQGLCHRPETGRCLYEDLVMQTVFAQFEMRGGEDWWQQHFGACFETVEKCLLWAGGSGQVGSMQCVRGVKVLWTVLQEWES